MAINEACQVWIEQRIKEELEDGGEKSLSEIARAIAAEIEKSFETSIKPDTIRKRAERMARTNVQNEENQGAPTFKPGHTGHKISPTEIVEEVEKRVRKGKSIREAAQEIADEHGKKQSAVREAYRREKEKTHYQCTATQAMSFAQMAIFQLERITKDDEQWMEALLMVENWINEFRSKK